MKAADFHMSISNILLNETKHFAVEAFRESGKTSFVLQAFPLYCLVYPLKTRSYIIIIKQNQRLAESKLKEIADLYTQHPIIKGNLIKIKEQSVKVFEAVVMGFGGNPVTIRFESYGKGSAMRGLNWGTKRPDVVIMDDVQDLEDSMSDTVQEKDWEWFLSDVKPLGKNTRIFMIGNNLGEKCLIERVIKNADTLEFDFLKIPAIDNQGSPAWAELFDVEFLQKEKESYAAAGMVDVWFRERMCVSISEESRTFKKEYFKYFKQEDLTGLNLDYYITVDPAISQKQHADSTAIVTVGKEKFSPNWYIVDIIQAKMTPSEIIEALFMLHKKYNPLKIGIEVVAYQQALYHFMQEEMRRRQVYPSIEEIKSTNKKEERIKGLQPLYKTGVIYQRANMLALEAELLSFPKGEHDDCADALSMMLGIINNTAIKKGSGAILPARKATVNRITGQKFR